VAKLTPLSKTLVTILVLGAVGAAVYKNRDKLSMLAPEAEHQKSAVPPKAELPSDPALAVPVAAAPGCADKPEMRFYHWAWNAQMGLI
jgi:hypothetical protein